MGQVLLPVEGGLLLLKKERDEVGGDGRAGKRRSSFDDGWRPTLAGMGGSLTRRAGCPIGITSLHTVSPSPWRTGSTNAVERRRDHSTTENKGSSASTSDIAFMPLSVMSRDPIPAQTENVDGAGGRGVGRHETDFKVSSM